MYLISVYFDKDTNRILQRYIDKIAKETGNDFMTKHKVPPHLTISSVEARSVEVLKPAMEALENKLSAGDIKFVSIGQLLPYVIYTTPVMNDYLLDLSKTIYHQVKDIPETKVSPYYKPMSWLPHVTLGKQLTKLQIQTAFIVMQDSFQVLDARITEIGLAVVNPHEDVVRFQLKS